MYKTEVEIYGDATNAAVMRHPSRRYPGILVQGDDLVGYCARIAEVVRAARGKVSTPAMRELEFLQEDFFDLLDEYTRVAGYPGIGTPPERA